MDYLIDEFLEVRPFASWIDKSPNSELSGAFLGTTAEDSLFTLPNHFEPENSVV